MGQIRTFLNDVKTRVDAIGSFNQIWVAPFVDIDRIVKIPRFPTAVIVDNGGTIDPYNGKIMTRQFSITILDTSLRDHIGEESSLDILDLGEGLVSALEYDTTIEIFNASDEDLEAFGSDSQTLVLAKTYNFVSEYVRS